MNVDIKDKFDTAIETLKKIKSYCDSIELVETDVNGITHWYCDNCIFGKNAEECYAIKKMTEALKIDDAPCGWGE